MVDAVSEAYDQKKLKSPDLATEAEQKGWSTHVLLVGVGCRGFVVEDRLSNGLSSHWKRLPSREATGRG